MSDSGSDPILALERAVLEDPGAAGFAALAELHRRSGRLADAEERIRRGLDRKPDAPGARLVLALCLIDQARPDEARNELERLASDLLATYALPAQEGTASPIEAAPVSDSEFDAAFDDVETDMDRIVDPNRVAEEAVSYVDGASGAAESPLIESLTAGSVFETSTMADLLESQGDGAGAARIRAAIEVARQEERALQSEAVSDGVRDRVLAKLERWLGNLRGDRS